MVIRALYISQPASLAPSIKPIELRRDPSWHGGHAIRTTSFGLGGLEGVSRSGAFFEAGVGATRHSADNLSKREASTRPSPRTAGALHCACKVRHDAERIN
jgi:hypothetical protein